MGREEATPDPDAPQDILAVWDALCSGQPPPAVQLSAGGVVAVSPATATPEAWNAVLFYGETAWCAVRLRPYSAC